METIIHLHTTERVLRRLAYLLPNDREPSWAQYSAAIRWINQEDQAARDVAAGKCHTP